MRELPSVLLLLCVSAALLLGALSLYLVHRMLRKKLAKEGFLRLLTAAVGGLVCMAALCGTGFFAMGLTIALGVRFEWF